MYQPMQRTITTPSERTLLSRPPLRRGFLLIPFAVAPAWLALSPTAQAVSPKPKPDGGYPGQNTAEGDGAGTTGSRNTAVGFNALQGINTGTDNTAIGDETLLANSSGTHNTATGSGALEFSNGSFNMATGVGALAGGAGNPGGNFNTATGASALSSTKGNNNTATGAFALVSNKTGFFNTADGFRALENNEGDNNIGLGNGARAKLTTGINNIDIGNRGVKGESGKIRIGTAGTQNATFIAGIFGDTVMAGGLAVMVDKNGQLGIATSSERFKEAIKPMDKASEAILALKPVTFRYKHKLDPEGIPQFGLVAEQVEKVNPNLVARDDQGKVITVRYEAVNAMLLNEFLKEHRKVQKLEAAIAQQQKDFQSTAAQQQKEIKALTASLKEQALQIQKVSGQREVSKFAPQTANGG